MSSGAWLNRQVRSLALAEAVSSAGTWLTMIAITTRLILRGQGGVVESSGIMMAGLLPALLFSPVAGYLADRWDRRWQMIASELASGLAVLGLVFANNLGTMFVLMVIQSSTSSFYRPARVAAITNLVPAADRQRLNALLSQVSGVIKAVSPALGGFVVALAGARLAMAIDVVSYGLSALLLLGLPPLRTQGEARPVVRAEAASGTGPGPHTPGKVAPDAVLGTILGTRTLRVLALTMFVGVVCISGIDLLLAVYVKDVFFGSERVYGLIISALGGGAIAGGTWLMLRKRRGNAWQDLRLGVALLGVLLATLGFGAQLGPSWWLGPATVALSFVGGVGNGVAQVQLETLVQELSPVHQLGRIAGILTSVGAAGRVLTVIVTPLLVPGLLSLGWFFIIDTSVLGLVVLLMAPMRLAVASEPVGGE